jgi:hypothetical protein
MAKTFGTFDAAMTYAAKLFVNTGIVAGIVKTPKGFKVG